MKKIFLLCFLFVLSLEVFADTPIEVGDVKIIGETTLRIDSLFAEKNVLAYWQIENPQMFSFKPVFSKIALSPPHIIGNRFGLEITGGNTNFYDFKGVCSISDVYKFTAHSGYEEFNENWNNSKIRVNWLPQLDNIQLGASAVFQKYNTNPLDTEIKRSTFWGEKDFFSHDDAISKLQMEFSYSSISQSDTTITELDAITNVDFEIFELNNQVSLQYLKKSASGSFLSKTTQIPYLEELGIWLALDEEKIYPSIQFNKELQLLENLSVILKNEPKITSKSRSSEIEKNYLQSVLMNELQTKQPINAKFIILNNYGFPITFFYNLKWNFDQLNYTIISEIYKIESVNRIINSVGIETGYEVGNFLVKQQLLMQKSDKQLSYFPNIKSDTSIQFEFKKYSFISSLKYLSGREDVSGNSMKDVWLLDLSSEYVLKNNLNLVMKINNLLNNEYKKYFLFPDEQISLNLGLRMVF